MKAIRIISLILAIIIVLGLAATGITAFAAENTIIDSIRINVENFAVGKSTADITFTLPEGGNYTVVNYTVETEDETPFSGTLGEAVYGMYIYVEPKDGYVFSEDDLGWNVDGDNMPMVANRETTSDSATFYAKFDLRDMTNVITKIEATISGMELGKPLSGVTVTAPAGVNYDVSINHFVDSEEAISDLSHVIRNQYYAVCLCVTPKEGYLMGDDAELVVNGGGILNAYAYIMSSDSYSIAAEYHFGTPINKVDITVTGMEAGKKASDVKVTVPAGVNYSLKEAWLYDEYFDDFTGTFQKSSTYFHVFDLTPADGCYFTNDTVVTVNGSEADYFEVYNSNGVLNVQHLWDLRPLIPKVEITVTGIEAGKSAADVKVTVPTGANYSLDEAWLCDKNYNYFTGTFQNGSLYINDIYLIPADGYRFDNSTVVTINGDEPDYFYMEDDDPCLNVEYIVDLRTLIAKVELPAATAPKVGDTIPAFSAPITPEGANYQYVGVWFTANGNNYQFATGSTFQNDTIYSLCYAVTAKEGCAFAKDVTVTAGGKAYTGMVQGVDDSDQLVLMETYPLGNTKLVNKITVSAEQPTAGKAPGKITGSGTGYTLEGARWGVANNGRGDNIDYPGATFQVGEYVYMGLELKLDEGYTLDLNTKVWLNGKSYSVIFDMIEEDEDSLGIVICLGKLKAATTPPTGDETPVALFALLTVSSILGMAVVLRRKSI